MKSPHYNMKKLFTILMLLLTATCATAQTDGYNMLYVTNDGRHVLVPTRQIVKITHDFIDEFVIDSLYRDSLRKDCEHTIALFRQVRDYEQMIVDSLDRLINDADRWSVIYSLEQLGGYSIFTEALKKTGLADTLQKNNIMDLQEVKNGYGFYSPKNVERGYTILAESDAVLASKGIHSFNDLVSYANNVYATSATDWYDYYRNKGMTVSTGADYTNRCNTLNMLMSYHILKQGVHFDELVRQGLNETSTADVFEYYETMLPQTLLKAYKRPDAETVYLNQWIDNNTLTDSIAKKGSEDMHQVKSRGAAALEEVEVEKPEYMNVFDYLFVANTKFTFDEWNSLSETDMAYYESLIERNKWNPQFTLENSDGSIETITPFPDDYEAPLYLQEDAYYFYDPENRQGHESWIVKLPEVRREQIGSPNGRTIIDIDDLVQYDATVARGVLNERMRFDFASIFRELGDAGLRLADYQTILQLNGGQYGNDDSLMGGDFVRCPEGFFNNLKIYNGDGTRFYYLPGTSNGWANYQMDEFSIKGSYDFAFRLPPVPDGIYEIRLGYTANGNRGIAEFSIGNSPDTLSMKPIRTVDMRHVPSDNYKTNGGVITVIPDEVTGWSNYMRWDDMGLASDSLMHEKGWMRGLLCFTVGKGGSTVSRANSQNLRLIITETELKQDDNWLHIKSAMGSDHWQYHLDYLEIVPKSVYANGVYYEDMY